MATATGKPGPQSRQSAAGRIVRAVIRGLYEGSYAPGQRMVEADLMAQFGVSRVTVREALHRLEAEGVLDTRPNHSAQIRVLGPDEALDALEVIGLCAGLAARQAAERIHHGENRAIFSAAWQQLLALQGAGASFELIKARNNFYRRIAEVSMNRELQRIIPTVHVHLIRRRYSLSDETRFDDYSRMAEAILAGNGPEAERASRDHIARTAALVRAQAG